MILAAGKGTRLRPLTDSRPKALVEVGGEPLIHRQMLRLKSFGFSDITVNVHHLAPMLCSYLEQNTPAGLTIHISDEQPRLLDTGGAVKHARPLLLRRDDGNTEEYNLPILVHNVDILSNAPLDSFFAEACAYDAALLVSRRQSSRQLYFHPETMRLIGWQNLLTGETRSPYPDFSPSDGQQWISYAFSGIHAVGPNALKAMDSWPDSGFSIIDFYLQECTRLNIRGIVCPNLKLLDVGKPQTLAQAEDFLKETKGD